MRTKSLIVSMLLLGAIVLSACGPAAIVPASNETPHTLNITGVGQVSLTPDIAYIYLGVHTEMSSASEAVAENNAQTEKVIAALKKMKKLCCTKPKVVISPSLPGKRITQSVIATVRIGPGVAAPKKMMGR